MKKLKSLDLPDLIKTVKSKKLPKEALRTILPRFALDGDKLNLVESADSLKETSEILLQNKIQFLITDWAFQDGSCIELIEKLRKTSDYKNLPIMVVTGRDSIDDLMTLVQLDVKDHLVKPFTFVEFEEKLNYCWERKQKSRV